MQQKFWRICKRWRKAGYHNDMPPLTAEFFARDAEQVAEDLIGTVLVREDGGLREAAMILETEAYVGPHDLACHAAKGRTPRTEAMFGPPGHWYVYFVYGMHWMLNIVTGTEGYPSAVLIRGVAGTNGPGRTAKRFGVNRELYGQLADTQTGLWIESRTHPLEKQRILRTPRIGVDYAGEWALKPLRFVLKPD